MQIKYESKPMCDSCPMFVLDVATDTLLSNDEVVSRLSTVRCKNRQLCDDIEKYLKKSLSLETVISQNLFDKGIYDNHGMKKSED